MVPVPLRHVEAATIAEIAEDVRDGLARKSKSLPPRLFYDAAGSALFEQITALPEYYLTRTERAIFAQHAEAIIAAAGRGLTLIELGAGTAAKTRYLIDALLDQQLGATFYPIDVSAAALAIAERNLTQEFRRLRVIPLVGDYCEGLDRIQALPGRKLVLYIGSSIGNYEPEEAAALLRGVRAALQPGDALLLGTDMVKDAAVLRAAYNDAQGVTAAFNRNMLARINRELGADFALDRFEHDAVWDPNASRIEMYLVSREEQWVRIAALGMTVHFAAHERLHTENSYKFTLPMVEEVLAHGGFTREATWNDSQEWFGVHLARVR